MSDPTEQFVEAMARAMCAVDEPFAIEVAVRAALTALRQAEAAAGWHCVPVEPTEEMGLAAWRAPVPVVDWMAKDAYRAMLATAPKPPGAP